MALLAALAGCSLGDGQGTIGGHVVATGFCGLDGDYQLQPSFFTAEVSEDNQLDIRIQQGSDLEIFSDGILIHVRDVNEVKRQRIGLPIPLDGADTSLVQAVMYLNRTCEAGFPNEHRRRPVLLEAVSGTITFDAVYAPAIDAGATRIEAELGGEGLGRSAVRFEDSSVPDERNATMAGWFSFFYQRGPPAQRFP